MTNSSFSVPRTFPLQRGSVVDLRNSIFGMLELRRAPNGATVVTIPREQRFTNGNDKLIVFCPLLYPCIPTTEFAAAKAVFNYTARSAAGLPLAQQQIDNLIILQADVYNHPGDITYTYENSFAVPVKQSPLYGQATALLLTIESSLRAHTKPMIDLATGNWTVFGLPPMILVACTSIA